MVMNENSMNLPKTDFASVQRQNDYLIPDRMYHSGELSDGSKGKHPNPMPLNLSVPVFTLNKKKRMVKNVRMILAVLFMVISAGGIWIYLQVHGVEVVNLLDGTGFSSADEQVKSRLERAYFYNQMNEEEKRLYETVYTGVMNYKDRIVIRNSGLSRKKIEKIVNYMYMQDWADFTYYVEYMNYIGTDQMISVIPKYTLSEAQREQRQTEIDAAAEVFLADIRETDTDYQKVRKVYEAIADQVAYVDDAPDNQNMYSSLVLKESVCAGYSKGFQYLMEKLDIPCIYLEGDSDGPHAWNMVEIEGEWYQVDVTWGDPGNEDDSADYEFLCITDEEMYRDHTPYRKKGLPKCTDMSYNYFAMNGCRFASSGEARTAFRDGLLNGQRQFYYQFEQESDYLDFKDFLSGERCGDVLYEAGCLNGLQWIEKSVRYLMRVDVL